MAPYTFAMLLIFSLYRAVLLRLAFISFCLS